MNESCLIKDHDLDTSWKSQNENSKRIKTLHETDYTKQFCQKQMHETKNTLYVRLSVKHFVKIFRFLGND